MKRYTDETRPKPVARHRYAMSAKAKSKIKNHESKLAEAVAVANAVEAAPPEVSVTPTNIGDPPAIAEAPVVNVPTGEAPSKLPLALRARVATSKVVVSVFANVRTVEAKAVQKALAWITAADVRISKSLVAGELFLLGHLRVTPE